MNIINWDYVLGSHNQKVPIVTFKPTMEFLDLKNFNNQKLWVTLENTGQNCYDGKSFEGIVDKSTDTNPCPYDMSYNLPLYTLTLACAPYVENMKAGKIALNKPVTPKYSEAPPGIKNSPSNPQKSFKKQSKEDKEFNLDTLSLSLLGGIGAVVILMILLK